MNALLSWLIVLGIFLVVLVGVKQIGVAVDWVLDHLFIKSGSMLWTGDECPCGQDREYHDREASRG